MVESPHDRWSFEPDCLSANFGSISITAPAGEWGGRGKLRIEGSEVWGKCGPYESVLMKVQKGVG